MFTGFWWNLTHSQRRKRDSNPRRYYPQQFSRLPQSTALPFLQIIFKIAFLVGLPAEASIGCEGGCKYRNLFLLYKAFLFILFFGYK